MQIDSASALQGDHADAVLALLHRADTVKVGSVPPGVYKRLIFNIHKPEDQEAVPDPVFRERSGSDQRVSVGVTGCVADESFVLKIHASIRQRVMFSSSLLLGASNEAVIVMTQAGVDVQLVGADG